MKTFIKAYLLTEKENKNSGVSGLRTLKKDLISFLLTQLVLTNKQKIKIISILKENKFNKRRLQIKMNF